MDPISIALGLSQFVPAIVRWLAGEKAGQAAETVVGIAQSVTGKATGPEALEALRADQQLQRQFQERLAGVEAELDKAYLADRQDARRRDVSMRQAGQHNYRADILAFLAVGGLCFCVWLVGTQMGLPERAVNAVMFVAGVFASAVRDVFAFEFGSSRSSQDKTELLLKR